MKRIILVAALVLVVMCCAGVSYAAGSYASIDVVNSYVGGSSGAVYLPHAALQEEVGHEFDNGIGASVWGSIPLSFENIGKNYGTEVDLNLWYHVNGNLKFGASYFFISPDLWASRNDIAQVNGEIGKELSYGDVTLAPGFRVEYDFPVDGVHNSQNTGLYFIPILGLNYKASNHLDISLNTRLLIDLGGFGAEKALITKFAPRVIYSFSKQFSANVGADWYIPTIKNDEDVRRNQFVPRGGISYTF